MVLTWVEERSSDSDASSAELLFARWAHGQWTQPSVIASGLRWFVNWADFPSLAVLDERHWIAHYLERSAQGTYDYNVQVVRSVDGGRSWNDAARLHTDPGPGEHGFVSLVPLRNQSWAAVWLDGRQTHETDETMGHASMALYARSIGVGGEFGPEILLDERVCDCCQTTAVETADGALLVAYRDRSADEVRDISIVRLTTANSAERIWRSDDGWKIPGCPVNGPVLAIAGERIGLVWFTLGSDSRARVLCALSSDSGGSFSTPTTLAGDRAVGRVDAAFDGAGRLVVTWLEGDGSSSEWRVARVDRQARVLDEHAVVTTTDARESGLARLAWDGSGMLFAFTEAGEVPRVAVRRLLWD